MFWTIIAIILVLWLLGFFTHVAIGGIGWLIHILLVVAIIAVLVRVIQGRRVF
jgi:hypothetical protein